MSLSIYLDYAAATPLDGEVLEAMKPYFSELFYNPSATYLNGRKVKDALSEARAIIAGHLGSRPSEIIFTAGGTEANNLAINGIMGQYPDGGIVVAAIEHDSVLVPAQQSEKLTLVSPNQDGIITTEALRKAIKDDTVLVSIGLINNEIGVVQPIKELAMVIEAIRQQRNESGNSNPLFFHTDACQAGNYVNLQVGKLGVDMMTINGGKLYGPKQSGALYIRAGLRLTPLIKGGGQEFGLRSGTENVVNSIGLAVALAKAQKIKNDEVERLATLQQKLVDELTNNFPDVWINGSLKNRSCNNIHATFPGEDNERLMMMLDERGIQCATGSACSASKDKPSHVLTAIGLSDADARSSLRFSFGRQTTIEHIDELVSALKDIIS